jgi:hypothetical protein
MPCQPLVIFSVSAMLLRVVNTFDAAALPSRPIETN